MADPVLIDDDDVVMVDDSLSKEPVVIVDEDDEIINNDETLSEPSVSTQETIIVDDESPITTVVETAPRVMNKQQEKTFISNLENNRLIDKIVTRCLTMDNATGMPRVVNKTLLPLYKQTSIRFKESDAFRALLKNTYKQLMKDPDHKFLHIKTLCEELKLGGIRNVPFVTLATNLKKNYPELDCIELTSSSIGIDQNRSKNMEIRAIPKINKRNYTTPKKFGARAKKTKVNPKDRVVTRSVTQSENTDIIDLDDSETESSDLVGSKNDVGQNDVIIVEETEPSNQRNVNLNTLPQQTLESNKVLQASLRKYSNKKKSVKKHTSEKDSGNENKMIQETIEANSCKNNKVTQSTFKRNFNKQNQVIQATSAINQNQYKVKRNVLKREGKQTIQQYFNTENKVIQGPLAKDSNKQDKRTQAVACVPLSRLLEKDANTQNKEIQGPLAKDSDKQDKRTQAVACVPLTHLLEKDANIQIKVPQDTLEKNVINGTSADDEMDYDRLIPKSKLMLVPASRIWVVSKPKPLAETEGRPEPGGGGNPGGGAERGGGAEPGGSAIVEAFPPKLSKDEIIARLEKRIAFCKASIDQLEEAEVATETSTSAYCVCSRYKEDVVACYKKICEITGNSGEIVKRQKIRLKVTKGHPPGPAKRLEDFLNGAIDATGAVPFPDLSDVVKCVVESKLSDNIDWNNQQTMQEAIALFRQCGQALRKRRQKREYRDLLALIPTKEESDDPAERDPLLLAKLEENKRIAKAKEEAILDRYVAMEEQNTTPQYTAEFDSDKNSSDLESESEQTITETPTTPCSTSNVNLYYFIPNNVNVSSTMISNNYSNVGQSSNTSNVFVNNLVVTPTLTAAPSIQNPLLLTYLVTAPTNPYFVNTNENQSAIRESENQSSIQESEKQIAIRESENQSSIRESESQIAIRESENQIAIRESENQIAIRESENQSSIRESENQIAIRESENQSSIRESENQLAIRETENQSSIGDRLLTLYGISNNQLHLDVLPANTRSSTPDSISEYETTDISDIEEKVDPETELTITETTVGFNTATSNVFSLNRIKIENIHSTANNQPCNVSDMHNTVSSSTDGIEETCDSSISPGVSVKTEDQIKSGPLDIQNMLDELGDSFVCQVFDIEDPFLVIEISSDESTDDEEL